MTNSKRPAARSLDLSAMIAEVGNTRQETMLELSTGQIPAGESFELADTIAETIPATVIGANSSGFQTHEEHRGEPRFRVRWRVSAVLANGESYHGVIKDISSKGAAILLSHDLKQTAEARLHIQVPPLNSGQKPHILVIRAKLLYTIHDNDELHFRSGLLFEEFKSDTDKNYLQSRLDNYFIKPRN